MSIDATDATFQQAVIDRSFEKPVVVDLWAPWCGPCRVLGPILDKVIGETNGAVELVKVNVDENQGISTAFGVQSIPMVVAMRNGQPVDGFMGAYPEQYVREFVGRLVPTAEEQAVQQLVDAGDEQALRSALELDPANEEVIVALAEVLVEKGEHPEALQLLAKVPETERVRRLAAQARLEQTSATEPDGLDERLDALLDRVKTDDEARQEYLDLLEMMGPDDPRTAQYRKKLTSRLF